MHLRRNNITQDACESTLENDFNNQKRTTEESINQYISKLIKAVNIWTNKWKTKTKKGERWSKIKAEKYRMRGGPKNKWINKSAINT